MTKIILIGAAGHMGRAVTSCVEALPNAEIVCGVDMAPGATAPFPIYPQLSDVSEQADVIIDFSRPSTLDDILDYCAGHQIGAVLATTGYSPEQKQEILEASRHVPIFQTPNLSIGVAVLNALAKIAARVLAGRCEVEIVERHHKRKMDAPSGTALALAETVKAELPDCTDFTYGRHGTDAARSASEIGIHAVRGGTIVGDHEIMFLCRDEEVDIGHKAYSREVFAQGAVAAAQFLAGKKNGVYNMQDLVQSLGLVNAAESAV